VKARWPDSRPAFWKPVLKNGARRRGVYEDQDAWISILAVLANAATMRGFVVNIAYLTAFSALSGSAIGGMASIATTWLTQHSQDRSQRHAQSEARRERLYGDFIDEASKLYIDALTHEQGDPSKFVQIYATIGKLRLFASTDVVSKADQVMRDISEIYYLPKRDFTKQQTEATTELNILRAFSEACREDLRD
jgi:hypothetical protein